MQVTKERPENGQCVIVWEYDGRVWSDTIIITEGEITHLYCQESDGFVDLGHSIYPDNLTYITGV